MNKALKLILIFVFGSWVMGFFAFFYMIFTSPSNDGEVFHNHHYKTSGVVVLTGGRGRIQAGVKLLKSLPNCKLLISGVKSKDLKEIFPYECTEYTRLYLGHKAKTTIGNALEAKEWLRDHPSNSLKIVTSFYHMPRSLLEFEMALPGIKLIPYPVKAALFSQSNWATQFIVWKTLFLEYNKYLLVLIKYYKYILTSTHSK